MTDRMQWDSTSAMNAYNSNNASSQSDFSSGVWGGGSGNYQPVSPEGSSGSHNPRHPRRPPTGTALPLFQTSYFEFDDEDNAALNATTTSPATSTEQPHNSPFGGDQSTSPRSPSPAIASFVNAQQNEHFHRPSSPFLDQPPAQQEQDSSADLFGNYASNTRRSFDDDPEPPSSQHQQHSSSPSTLSFSQQQQQSMEAPSSSFNEVEAESSLTQRKPSSSLDKQQTQQAAHNNNSATKSATPSPKQPASKVNQQQPRRVAVNKRGAANRWRLRLITRLFGLVLLATFGAFAYCYARISDLDPAITFARFATTGPIEFMLLIPAIGCLFCSRTLITFGVAAMAAPHLEILVNQFAPLFQIASPFAQPDISPIPWAPFAEGFADLAPVQQFLQTFYVWFLPASVFLIMANGYLPLRAGILSAILHLSIYGGQFYAQQTQFALPPEYTLPLPPSFQETSPNFRLAGAGLSYLILYVVINVPVLIGQFFYGLLFGSKSSKPKHD